MVKHLQTNSLLIRTLHFYLVSHHPHQILSYIRLLPRCMPPFFTSIHSSAQIMTLKGGTSQACAACKYQRKRCTPECALAPHFRPEQTEIFKNAHKLFGVRNILRILEQIDPAQKTEAMRSIIYQANMRDRFPVHGCLGIICHLQYQIRQAEKELYAVLSQLEFYKQHQRRQQEITLSPMDSPESQQLQLGMGVEQSANANAVLTLFQHEATDAPHQQFVPACEPMTCASFVAGSVVLKPPSARVMKRL